MRRGYKAACLILLLVLALCAVAGAVLNLVWNDESPETRMWLGWAMLFVDTSALVVATLVTIFHWRRQRVKRVGKFVPLELEEEEEEEEEEGENGEDFN